MQDTRQIKQTKKETAKSKGRLKHDTTIEQGV